MVKSMKLLTSDNVLQERFDCQCELSSWQKLRSTNFSPIKCTCKKLFENNYTKLTEYESRSEAKNTFLRPTPLFICFPNPLQYRPNKIGDEHKKDSRGKVISSFLEDCKSCSYALCFFLRNTFINNIRVRFDSK